MFSRDRLAIERPWNLIYLFPIDESVNCRPVRSIMSTENVKQFAVSVFVTRVYCDAPRQLTVKSNSGNFCNTNLTERQLCATLRFLCVFLWNTLHSNKNQVLSVEYPTRRFRVS